MNTSVRTFHGLHRLRPLLVSACLLWLAGLVPAGAADAPGAGISLGTTRLILNEQDGGASVRVINTSSAPFLIQSWVDSYKGQGGWENAAPLPPGAFVVTPPLFRLDKGENSVLIRRAGGNLPADRESVFSLNVKAIPQTEKPDPKSNYVQFAFVNSIKLFWRPAGLTGSAADAYKQLTFKRAGAGIDAVNPTPYHLTVKKLTVGGHDITDPDTRMVPPKGSQHWPLPAGAGGQVTFVVINDFGGLTPPLSVPLQ